MPPAGAAASTPPSPRLRVPRAGIVPALPPAGRVRCGRRARRASAPCRRPHCLSAASAAIGAPAAAKRRSRGTGRCRAPRRPGAFSRPARLVLPPLPAVLPVPALAAAPCLRLRLRGLRRGRPRGSATAKTAVDSSRRPPSADLRQGRPRCAPRPAGFYANVRRPPAVPRSAKLHRLRLPANAWDIAAAPAGALVNGPSAAVGGRTHRPGIAVGKGPEGGRISGAVRIPRRLATEADGLFGHRLHRFSPSSQLRAAAVRTGGAAPARALAGAPGGRGKIGGSGCGKGAMAGLAGRMPKAGAILHDPRSGSWNEGHGGPARGGFTPAKRRRAAARTGYPGMLDRSPRFEPAPGAHHAGIREEERPRGILLRIKRYTAPPACAGASMELRAAFACQYVVPEIAAGTLGGGGPGGS